MSVSLIIQRILSVQYSIPDYVRVSVECRNLLSRIFVANPAKVTHSSFQIFVLQFASQISFTHHSLNLRVLLQSIHIVQGPWKRIPIILKTSRAKNSEYHVDLGLSELEMGSY